MARYYFQLSDGKEVLKAGKGLELLGNAAAREEAVILARELKDGKVMPGRSWDGWFVQIVDQHGHEVDTVPIDAVPE
jgi:Domain of unknown function (DUF6894)